MENPADIYVYLHMFTFMQSERLSRRCTLGGINDQLIIDTCYLYIPSQVYFHLSPRESSRCEIEAWVALLVCDSPWDL